MRKVVILNSSPRKNGNSDTLAQAVLKGTEAGGALVQKFDLARMSLQPCRGCYACQMGRGDPCVQKDEMKKIYDTVLEADAVVLATPLYWQQMNGVMKNAIDRFFALSGKTGKKDTALIVSGATAEGPIYDKINAWFRDAFAGPEVLDWNVTDIINAGGLVSAGDAKKSAYYEKAYRLGAKIAVQND